MYSVAIFLALVSIACAAPAPGNWSFDTCMYTSNNGSVFNFGTLARKTMTWVQTITDLTNQGDGVYDLFNYADLAPVKYTFEVALCGAVVTQFPNACTNMNSAVNIIDNSGNCYSAGDVRTASMVTVPYNNGVSIRYFFGDPIDHTIFHRSAVYLLCGSAANIYFEHKKNPDDHHFKLMTPLACK